MDLSTALQRLSTYRSRNTRASQEIFDNGVLLLKSNSASNLGDESWAFLEQLALAAIDVGRLDIADRSLQLLTDKFPGSPRVDCLAGIRIEASESPETALKYYEELLDADPVNVAAWKRKVSVLRRLGKVEKATNELIELLDAFYTDVEGWLELADIYASCSQYTSSLRALNHVLLLSPQNPFYFLLFAETAYTSGDITLAIKNFLVVADMTDPEDDAPNDELPTGISVRAWFGVQLCARRLRRDSRLSSFSASQTTAPPHLQLLDELATEKIKTAYSSGTRSDVAAKEVSEWLARA